MENQQSEISRDLPSTDFLYAEYISAFHFWLELFQAPDCLVDFQKRKEMLASRCAYHEAKFEFVYRQRSEAAKINQS